MLGRQPLWGPWILAVYALALWVMSLNLYSYLFDGSVRFLFNLLLSLALAATVFGGVYLYLRPLAFRPTSVSECVWTARLTRWLPALVTTGYLAMYIHRVVGDRRYTSGSAVVAGLAIVSSVVAIRSGRMRKLLPWVLTAATVANLLLVMPRVSVGSDGDMLIRIQHAVDRMLDGLPPYVDTRVPGTAELDYSSRPLTYFPGMWLAYLPFRMIGLDIRFLSVLSLGVVCAILIALGRSNPSLTESELATIIAAAVCSPLMWIKLPALQTPVSWAMLLLLCVGITRNWPAAILGTLLGLTVMIRESTLILIPAILVFLFRRYGFLQCAVVCATSTLVAFGLMLPFIFYDHSGFFSSVTYILFYMTSHAVAWEVPFAHIGLGGWLHRWGLSDLAVTVQVMTILAASYRLAHGDLDISRLFFSMGIIYFVFMFFNTYVFEYYYVPAVLLVGLGLVTAGALRAADGATIRQPEVKPDR